MANHVLHPDKKELEALVQKEKLVLVDFWAAWCMPCKMLAPVIEQIADQYAGKVAVAKIDIDEHEDLAMQFGIQSIPTVLLFENGRLVEREVGVKPASAFTNMLDNRLASGEITRKRRFAIRKNRLQPPL